jgi:hypothetical protein
MRATEWVHFTFATNSEFPHEGGCANTKKAVRYWHVLTKESNETLCGIPVYWHDGPVPHRIQAVRVDTTKVKSLRCRKCYVRLQHEQNRQAVR